MTYSWVMIEGSLKAHLLSNEVGKITTCGRKVNPVAVVRKAVNTDKKCGLCLRTNVAKRTAT